MIGNLTVFAFSDPNDLLSYGIPPKFADDYMDSRICPRITNIILNVAQPLSLLGMGARSPTRSMRTRPTTMTNGLSVLLPTALAKTRAPRSSRIGAHGWKRNPNVGASAPLPIPRIAREFGITACRATLRECDVKSPRFRRQQGHSR